MPVSRPAPDAPSAKRILIIDDSPTSRLWQQMMLAKETFEVHVAESGELGLDLARKVKPDLILLDVIMPGLDGFATCEALRSRPATRTIPIVMVTTRGEAINVERGYQAGCTDYITKPIDRLEFLAKVRSHLTGTLAETAP